MTNIMRKPTRCVMLCTVMTITTDGCFFIGLYLVELFVTQSDFTVCSDAHRYCSFVMLQRNGGGVLTYSVKRNLKSPTKNLQ